MLRRVQLPPKLFAEILRLAANTLQIIEILGRYLLKHRTEVRHRHGRETVLFARIIQVTKEESH